MNAVEIEEAVSKLAEEPFDPANFPYAFLEAFGNKPTTIQRLRSGASNKSDIEGGVLQHNNIHIAVAPKSKTHETLVKLKVSPATTKQKAKFILATDGREFQAEDLTSNDPPLVCEYKDFANHFGFFLPLAGISTVKQIRDSAFDIKATGRLNRLYVELLKDNPSWGTAKRHHDMNHFMARLIFCFFAEDTDIFKTAGLFSSTVEQMSAKDSSNTHEVIEEIFRAMNTKSSVRAAAKLPRWVDDFPYVNGGLFSGSTEVPRFSKIARSYLLHIGNLEWKQINPDIFGSMIQAVAEDDERGALGMHYTSVPNILRVLNPLFLDDLRSQLEKAGDNARALLNLRKRISRIRVFDPACGSGNFLVIAYKEMRAIEAEINRRRGETNERTELSITNFRGIELRDFPAEIARLALIIAEYQCDVLYRGQKEALLEFLPLEAENWITCGNALHLDWRSICPPHAAKEERETYICGNPPYLGFALQSEDQKKDLQSVFENRTDSWKNLDYVAAWFIKAAEYGMHTSSAAAFVATNSICQGQQVLSLWPLIYKSDHEITFAHTSFKWANLANHNAGVTVVIVGISKRSGKTKHLFTADGERTIVKEVERINAYLVPTSDIYVASASQPQNGLHPMDYGSKPADGGHLVLTFEEKRELGEAAANFIKPYIGSNEFIDNKQRFCLWLEESDLTSATKIPKIAERINNVKLFRSASKKLPTKQAASRPYAFLEIRHGENARSSAPLIVPIHTSENREYLPIGFLSPGTVVSNAAFAIYDAPLWNMAVFASRIHLVWIGAVCGKLKTDYRYSNTLGWNTFPLPTLTEKNKDDLTRCAEDILLAREAHFPASIADLYDPEAMPEDLRRAHERNDEVLERIYIGRRFKNDSERLEKLFDLYTKMVAKNAKKPQTKGHTKVSKPKAKEDAEA